MHPILFHLGPLPIHTYGVLMSVGFLVGLLNWAWLGRREGWRFDMLSDLLFWIMVTGVVGARAAYVISNFDQYARAPLDVFRVWEGGLIYYGGMIAAMGAIVVFARRSGQPFLRLVDLVVTSLPLGHAFGRIGCFLNGCCYGRPWTGALSVRYPAGSLAWSDEVNAGLVSRYDLYGLPLHAVQLYEAVFNLGVYALLAMAYRRPHPAGRVAAVYLITYPVGRLLLEMLRGDERQRLAGVSAAQWISMALIGLGVALFAYSRRPHESSLPGRAG